MAFPNLGYVPSGAVNPINSINQAIGGITQSGYVPTQAAPSSDAVTDTYNGGGSTSSGGGGAATYDPYAAQRAANYALIDQQLGRLPGQLQTGLNNIGSSYQSAFDTLTRQKGLAQQQYDTTRTNNIQDNQTAKDNIATGVRNGINGLQRLLGAHGAGNSSAAQILAPYAAGVQGNQQRQQVQTAFGRNMGALDTNWNNTLDDFTISFGSLASDKTARENALRAQTLQNQASLMGQKANPDLNAINDLGHQIDALGAVQTFDPGVHEYKAPDLAQYNYDASQGANLNAPQDGAASDVGPFFQLLGKKKQGAGVA